MRGTRRQRIASEEAGRLQARPQAVPHGEHSATIQRGLQQLEINDGRAHWLYVPQHYAADRPAPLVVLLHGAGGSAQHGLALLLDLADSAGLILLAPQSRGASWDVIYGGYGPDIAALDQLLAQTFARYTVDTAHVAISGFSDGASYALSVGLTNGDLFTHVLAFAPGFMAPADQHGQPRIFVTHGTHDQVLPIDRCSRRLVPALQQAGYDVTYHEFDGPHTVPPTLAEAGVAWWLAD